MGATNKMLAKRLDELTEALTDIRERVEEVKKSEDMDEVADAIAEIGEDIDELIGSEGDDRDSE